MYYAPSHPIRTEPPSIPPGTTTATLLRALQHENDSLRTELLQGERARDQLAQRLEMATTQATSAQFAASAAAAKRSASSSVHMQQLQERCELLADRLLTSVRDQQLSQSAEVFFLLRTQQEERHYLCAALESMLEGLAVEDAASKRQRQEQMYHSAEVAAQASGASDGAGTGSGDTGGLHAGTVYRLMMTVADGLQVRSAQDKIEKAEARLKLEQATAVVYDLQQALEKVTRTVFGCSQTLLEDIEAAEEATTAAGGGSSAFAHSTADFSRLSARDHASGLSASRAQRLPLPQGPHSSMGNLSTLPASHQREVLLESAARLSLTADNTVEDLEWASDVLKACYRGLGEAGRLLETACTTMTAGASSTSVVSGTRGGNSTPLAALATVGSPETMRLLQSIRADLQEVATRSARSQEAITRRLSEELQRHYETTKQYEARIRMLEGENSRLIAVAAKGFSSRSAATPRPGTDDGMAGAGGMGELGDVDGAAVAARSTLDAYAGAASSIPAHTTAGLSVAPPLLPGEQWAARGTRSATAALVAAALEDADREAAAAQSRERYVATPERQGGRGPVPVLSTYRPLFTGGSGERSTAGAPAASQAVASAVTARAGGMRGRRLLSPEPPQYRRPPRASNAGPREDWVRGQDNRPRSQGRRRPSAHSDGSSTSSASPSSHRSWGASSTLHDGSELQIPSPSPSPRPVRDAGSRAADTSTLSGAALAERHRERQQAAAAPAPSAQRRAPTQRPVRSPERETGGQRTPDVWAAIKAGVSPSEIYGARSLYES